MNLESEEQERARLEEEELKQAQESKIWRCRNTSNPQQEVN